MHREETLETASTLQRLAPWAGILFAVLVVGGFLLASDTPDSTDTQAWLEFHDDQGNRVQQIIGGYIGVLSAFVFLWFAHGVIAQVSGGRAGDLLTSLARSGATLFAGLLAVAMVALVSVSAAVEVGDVARPQTADFGIQLEQLAFGILLVAGCMAAALFIASVSELARQSGVFPRWLVSIGFVVAVVLLAGALFFPLVLIPVWALVAAIMLLTRRGQARA